MYILINSSIDSNGNYSEMTTHNVVKVKTHYSPG